MTAKEFLLQYGNTKAEIETLLDQIIAQRELAEKITVSFDNDGGTSGTRKTDKLESCVEKIIDLEDEIIRRSGELADIRKSVYNTRLRESTEQNGLKMNTARLAHAEGNMKSSAQLVRRAGLWNALKNLKTLPPSTAGFRAARGCRNRKSEFYSLLPVRYTSEN